MIIRNITGVNTIHVYTKGITRVLLGAQLLPDRQLSKCWMPFFLLILGCISSAALFVEMSVQSFFLPYLRSALNITKTCSFKLTKNQTFIRILVQYLRNHHYDTYLSYFKGKVACDVFSLTDRFYLHTVLVYRTMD